jgi:hypothetical protein
LIASQYVQLVRAQHFEEGDTLAVWISNAGLTSKNYILTFGELHECLCGIANAAAMLANGGQQAAAEPLRTPASQKMCGMRERLQMTWPYGMRWLHSTTPGQSSTH